MKKISLHIFGSSRQNTASGPSLTWYKGILLVPEAMKHQMQTPVYAFIYADIYGSKVQIWKERDLKIYFSAFLQRDFTKEKYLFFFKFFFPSVNNPVIFRVGNCMGSKC